MTAQVPDALYRGAGWAVAAVINERGEGGAPARCIAVRYLDDAADRKPTLAEIVAATAALKADAAVLGASAAWEALDCDDDPDDDRAATTSVHIEPGVMSGGEFCFTIGRADQRRMGLPV